MERIAKFEKVSKERFVEDFMKIFGDRENMTADKAEELYYAVKIPKRATKSSAGYDICTPVDIVLKPGESIKIPTGLRVRMREDYCLFIMPRSGLGSKFRFQLNNTVGVIDSDYYNSDNEGHIFVPMINDGREGKVVSLKAGDAFVQGVFLSYGITEDDEADAERNGGFGSTGLKRAAAAGIATVLSVFCLMGCGFGADRYALRDEAVQMYSSGDYEGAAKKLDEALAASDGQVSDLQFDILKYRAECELRLGNYSEAKANCEALVKLSAAGDDEKEYEALLSQLDALDAVEKADRLFNAGEYSEAYENYKEYAALDGTAAGSIAWYNMAVCEEYLGKFNDAAEHLARYTEQYPDDIDAAREYEFSRSRAD